MRTVEQSVRLLELYGFRPEMGHKEVGGVKAHLTGTGTLDHILEQLEIDWRYDSALQAADNELAIRILIKEVFRLHGLEVSFLAKPIHGVAGSGEHTHINATATLRSGERINLFSPADFDKDYLSETGWGALMGIMKHYNDAIAPFVTSSNDAFRRLQPGYEAPTHAVASIGDCLSAPSRNRTVLLGLIRSPESPAATRFELRSPNPHSNIFFTLSAVIQTMLDGIHYVFDENRSMRELESEFLKEAGDDAPYLRKAFAYNSEDDIFHDYDAAERDRLFGKPAASVYETCCTLHQSAESLEILCRGGVFTKKVIHSYTKSILDEWELELRARILEDNLERIRAIEPAAHMEPFDVKNWRVIDDLRRQLAKSDDENLCLLPGSKKHSTRKITSLRRVCSCKWTSIF